MSSAPVRAEHLTRDFRGRTAVDSVSFEVQPGRVTGLLGRNGAGKTTTLRMVLGLSKPTGGTATVFGQRYEALSAAPRRIGVSMGDIGTTPGASVIGDLRNSAAALNLPLSRCEQVLDFVGLEERGKKVAKLSTGMRQRYGLAVALLAEPELLILDEPANGLDPDGIRWLRDMLRAYASGGRTVLLSSHQLAEVEQTVDDVVVIQQSLRYAGTLEGLTRNGIQRLETAFFQLVGAPQTGEGPSGQDPAQTRRLRRKAQ